jgi:uncharacterized membrane protein
MEYVSEHWLALFCLVTALELGAAALIVYLRVGGWLWTCYLPAAILASYGIGALDFLPVGWLGAATAVAAFCVFAGMLALVILTGSWSAPLGYAVTCLLFFGLGDWSGGTIAESLRLTWLFLTSLRPQEPWWLILLVAVPLLIWTSWHNLITLGPTRRWLVLGLRCSLVVLLALALAEAYARKPNDDVTVIFLWDRSLSIPPDYEGDKDLREERILHFINESVAQRGPRHANDRVGVIVFGKQARLELPPGAVPRLNFSKVLSQVDNTYTDIGAAMKLALASFPDGVGKRIVLISDGNENMGRAEEQARIARQNGVQVDIVPITSGRKHQNEILVDRIEAPAATEKGTQLPMRVVIRSFHPDVVVAQLNLRKIILDPAREDDPQLAPVSTIVKLRQGFNVYVFQQAGAKHDTAFAYEASVVPIHVETEEGKLQARGLPGDRFDNNKARVTIMARGQRTVLILEERDEKRQDVVKHQLLVKRLQAARSGLKVVVMTPDQMRTLTKGDNEQLATFLNRFDAVFLANVPAESISEDEQKVIRSHVHDQGAGLVMIGGNQSFGAGGWQNTEIEKALPVNMELKSMKIEGRSGLVLIMHASEMQEGNAWQRKIAKLAIEKLSARDWMGLLHYNHGFGGGAAGHQWHIPFQEMGEDRRKILKLVDSMQPGDMPDVDPAFAKAHKELSNKELDLGTKHIIFISDGDHWDASPAMMARLRNSKITCTTVCITSHGQNEVKKMAAVARAAYPGGRSYHIKDPKELPAIYIRETRLVSQSFIHEDKKGFGSSVLSREGPTEGMVQRPPPLYGFVRTTPKESSLVKVLIETDVIGQYKFPLLAAWQYGLGKSVAFTSDARTIPDAGEVYWDRDWANSDLYAKFWEQTVDWVLRPTETGRHLFLTTEHKDGRIRIMVEAKDDDQSPLTEVELKAGITSPAFKVKDDKKSELKFEQKNAGVYEAEIAADEVGAYFLNIQAKWKKTTKGKDGKEVSVDMMDHVRAGVTIPYSPEFAETDSNPGFLEKIRDLTGGKAYAESRLAEAARSADVFRATPQSHASLQALWPWLVFLTALCLLMDVAIRRIAIQPEMLWAKAVATWQKLRGQASADDKVPEYIERLKSRKAAVGETMDKQKAAKKFEAAETGAAMPTVVPVTPVDKPKPAPKKVEKKVEEDFATRLMRAKKKAMEERDKDKPT